MTDQNYMQRCLQLAAKAQGKTAPNPLVGAVLVYNNQIIGEGFHQQYGQAHAEVNCFNSVAEKNKGFIRDATLYVSLEPCAHFGKTPPCANRIVQEGVKKVVICNTDPFEKVAGKGIQILKDHGIQIITGVLEEEGNWLNRRFFTYHQQQRPYIFLKWAQTENGFFAPADRTRFQMSDGYSTRISHQWRREEAAIMVGFTTGLHDNPQLVSRYGKGIQPLRIVLDKNLKIPETHYLLSQNFPTWIINQHKNEIVTNLHFVKMDFSENVILQLLQKLFEANILSLIIEGGAHLLQCFIDENLWDEARIFKTSSKLENGIVAPLLNNAQSIFQIDLALDKLQVLLHKNYTLTYPTTLSYLL